MVSKALIVVMPMAFQSVTGTDGSAQLRYTTSWPTVLWEGLVAILVPSMGLEKAHSLQQLGELKRSQKKSEKI